MNLTLTVEEEFWNFRFRWSIKIIGGYLTLGKYGG